MVNEERSFLQTVLAQRKEVFVFPWAETELSNSERVNRDLLSLAAWLSIDGSYASSLDNRLLPPNDDL